MKLLSSNQMPSQGALIRRPTNKPDSDDGDRKRRKGIFRSGFDATRRKKMSVAFAGVLCFSLLLYLRPQELYPEIIGSFPLIKIVAIGTLVAYVLERVQAAKKLSIFPLELKMVMLIWVLGWVMIPFAQDPGRSIETLTDTYLKVMIIFLMMVNLLNDRRRLFLLIRAINACGLFLAAGAIRSYLRGEMSGPTNRITGIVNGIFGNPNDLATSFDLLIPLAVVLVIVDRGFWRIVALISIPVMATAVLLTFSRAGFLGLLLLSGFLLWKIGKKSRIRNTLLGLLAGAMFLIAMPGNYSNRISTIFDNDADKTGSAQERREILNIAIDLSIRRPIFGVGMSNFPIYSIHERVAHNSYFETSAELGVIGLLAYLTLIFAPLRNCWRLEKQARPAEHEKHSLREYFAPEARRQRELYYLSIGLQATILAYILCSFFASIQYLWFLYYPVAYVVGLKQIVEAENPALSGLEPVTARGLIRKRKAMMKGKFWQKQAAGNNAGALFAEKQSQQPVIGRLFKKR